MAASTGGLFTSLTITVKVRVSLSGGAPLSVTRTVNVFVLGPCASVGVQVKTPVLGSRFAPGGALTRANVNVLDGLPGSVADSVRVRGLPSLIVWLAIGASAGGLFALFTTTTVKLRVALRLGTPLSVTRTVMRLVLGACVSFGVQVNRPVLA